MSGVGDTSRIRWTPARMAAAAAMLALAVLIVAWHAWLVVPSIWVPRWLAIVLHSFVLWPGLFLLALRHRAALFFGALAGLVLFSLGVMEAWTTPAVRGLALTQTALAIIVVVGSSLDGLRARFARKRGV